MESIAAGPSKEELNDLSPFPGNTSVLPKALSAIYGLIDQGGLTIPPKWTLGDDDLFVDFKLHLYLFW